MEALESAEDCVQTSMIAWVQYPNSLNKECFVYPRYAWKYGCWFEVDPEAFPNNGSFLAFVTGKGSDAQQINEQYGSLVVARVNAPSFDDNSRYETTRDISSKYRSAINPDFHKGNSDLEFDVFSETPFSSELIQVVSADNANFAELNPDNSLLSIDVRSSEPVCQNIVVKVREYKGEVLYGPFEYTRKEEGVFDVRALASYDYRIGRLSIAAVNCLMPVADKDGNEVATFIEESKFQALFSRLKDSEMVDWLPGGELVSEVCRAISSAENFKVLGKSQLRQIKAAVVSCSEVADGLRLDDGRRTRMLEIVLRMEDLLTLDDTLLQAIVDRVDNNRLGALFMDANLFSEVEDRLMENAGVKEKIDDKKRLLEQQLEGIKDDIREFGKKRERAEEETETALRRAEEAKRESERIREDILSKSREELQEIKEETKRATEERDQIIHQRMQAQEAFNKVFDGINDEVAASTKILESEVLRKVVAKVSESELPIEDETVRFAPSLVLRDSEGFEATEMAESIYHMVTEEYGRDCDYNDVVNYMVCLMQGYITTFAGLPGTGKTSLCNILGGALGLKNQQYGDRFIEVNVESGWTSYKDYVGYYNPLSKRYEKANARVYDAMKALSRESDAQIEYPPFVVLLDEANLSSMEHYWAPFLRACDNFELSGTQLSPGGSENWLLPSHLRFMATVNFDHTTEALSPRFLDRSWVITLNPLSIELDDIAGEEMADDGQIIPFSYAGLIKAFGKRKRLSVSAPTKALYDRLLKICREHSFSVSPRSQAMVLHYVTTAESLMKTSSRDSQFAPLDYAFSQKILPMIHGPAETVGEFVQELEVESSQLQMTHAYLNRMIRQGEDSGFYQFFA